ncbi:unnamed protein product, partial [Effrenium voratum]
LLLDVSELLNLRAYARTYVSSRPRMVLELEEALQHATDAADCPEAATGGELTPLRGFRRAQLLLGRTLCSAAHSLALNYITGEPRERLLARYGSSQKMFALAVQQLRAAKVEVSEDEPDLLTKGIVYAALGECFFCMA